ncbi:Uncharacterized protein SCG7086_AH_00090 [Chlamydiales bacterium SCGC AG-110-P3]|nr:Uncharacterized protein SCG7086_AH_00090 [Chlamydiales bacterium SCGC AG-110-P3]
MLTLPWFKTRRDTKLKLNNIKQWRFAMAPFYWSVRMLFFLIYKIFYRMRVYGTEHVIDDGAIIAPNHASYFDPPFIATAWPHELTFLARENLFNVWGLSWLIRHLNAHPVSGRPNDIGTLRLIGQLVTTGSHVVIFPEGARTLNHTLQPLKLGVAMLAIRNGCPVIPCHIEGTYKVWPPHQRFPKPWGRLICVFGSAINPESFMHLDRKKGQQALTDTLEAKLHELREWYHDGAMGSPP